tara:strand:- start:1138 stop:2031 length:894 start_codon:yes stop_codon:yes gene_type:complete
MGIKNLSKLLAKVAPACRRERVVADYAGQRLAIDTPIYMWKFASMTNGNPLRCFREQLREFRTHRITPMYVFDGAAAPAKLEEVARRREQRAGTKNAMFAARKQYLNMRQSGGMMTRSQIRELSTAKQRYEKLRRRVQSVPTRAHYDGLRHFLREQQVAFFEAEGDAEKVCAELVGKGEADAAVTDDYDALVYMCTLAEGSGKMVIGINRPTVVEYDVADMLREIQFDSPQFVDMCILSGCDFCNKIGGVACNRAFQLVSEHGSIENILENLDPEKFSVPQIFDYLAARDQFGLKSE